MNKRTKRGLTLLLSLVLVLGIGVTAFASESMSEPAESEAALVEDTGDLAALETEQEDDPPAEVAVLGFEGYSAGQALAFGAGEGEVALPGTIQAATEGDEPIDVDVTWALEQAAFDGGIAGAVYTYVGTPAIPEGYSWDAAAVAAPVITVTVGEEAPLLAEEDDGEGGEDVVTYTVESFDALGATELAVAFEEPYAGVQAKLPATLKATVKKHVATPDPEGGDPTVTTTTETGVDVPVVWSSTNYDNKTPGTYTFTAALAGAETYAADAGLTAMPTVDVTVDDKPAGEQIDDPSLKKIKITINDAQGESVYEGDPAEVTEITIDFGTTAPYVAMDIEGDFELSNAAKAGLKDGDWSYFAWLPDFPVDWDTFVPIELYAEVPDAVGGGVEQYHLATLTVGNRTDVNGHNMRPIIITYREGALQLDDVSGYFEMNFSLSREIAEEKELEYDLDLGDNSFVIEIDLGKTEPVVNDVAKKYIKRYHHDVGTPSSDKDLAVDEKDIFDRLLWRVDANLTLSADFPGTIVDELTSANHKFTDGSIAEVAVYAVKGGAETKLTATTHYTVTRDGDSKLTIQLNMSALGYGPAEYSYSAYIVSTVVDGTAGSNNVKFTNKVTTPLGKDGVTDPTATADSGIMTRYYDNLKGGTITTSQLLKDGSGYYVTWTMNINRQAMFKGDANAAAVTLTETLGDYQSLFNTFTFDSKTTTGIESVQLYEYDRFAGNRVKPETNMIGSGNFYKDEASAASATGLHAVRTGDKTLEIRSLDLRGKSYQLVVYAKVSNEDVVAARANGLKDKFEYTIGTYKGGANNTIYFNGTDGKPTLEKTAGTGVDWDNSQLSWTVTLKTQGRKISDLIFEDVFGQTGYTGAGVTAAYADPPEGQMDNPDIPKGISLALLKESLEVKLVPANSSQPSQTTITLDEGTHYTLHTRSGADSGFETGFIVKLKGTLNDTAVGTGFAGSDPASFYNVVITYKTEFELTQEDGVGYKGYKFRNAVSAQGKLDGKTTPEALYKTADKEVTRAELTGNGKKSGALKTENGVSTIDWTIRFNTHKRDNLGVVSIRDAIADDQRLLGLADDGGNLAGLVKVYRGSVSSGNLLTNGKHYTINPLSGSQGFEVVFDKEGVEAVEYIIQFTTEPVGAVKSIYENKAEAWQNDEKKAEYPATVALPKEDKLFGKTGKVDGAYLRWDLTINEDYDLSKVIGSYDGKELEDLSIVDTLSAGQVFVNSGAHTLKVYSSTGDASTKTLLTAATDANKDDPTAGWDYRVDVVEDQDITGTDPKKETTTVTITFHKDFKLAKNQRLDVTYYSQLDRGSLPAEYLKPGNIAEVSNSARFTASKYAYQNSVEKSVVASGGSGGGRGEKYKLRVLKVDADNNNLFLENAQFRIYNSSGQEITTTPMSTNNQGYFDLELLAGTYYVKEVVAPEGYDLDPSSASEKGREVKVPGADASKDEEGRTVAIFENSLIKYTLQVRKQNSANTSEVLSGAIFELYNSAGKLVATKTTGANGIAKFTGLLPGKYRLVETRAPDGYVLPADNTTYVTIKDAPNGKRTVTVSVDNTPILTPPTDPEDPEEPVTPPIIVRPEVDPPPEEPVETPPTVTVPDPPAEDTTPPVETETEDLGGGPLAENLGPGGVPLGGLDSIAWSLLNLIMSLIALFAAVTLIVTMFKRKKVNREADAESGEEPDEKVQRNRLFGLRVLAILGGFIPGILFLILENIRLPMVWITRWTPLIGAFFIISMTLVLLHAVIKKRGKTVEDDEPRQMSQQPS